MGSSGTGDQTEDPTSSSIQNGVCFSMARMDVERVFSWLKDPLDRQTC